MARSWLGLRLLQAVRVPDNLEQRLDRLREAARGLLVGSDDVAEVLRDTGLGGGEGVKRGALAAAGGLVVPDHALLSLLAMLVGDVLVEVGRRAAHCVERELALR